MSKFTDSTADSLTAVSGLSAVAHLATQWQPIISFLAGCVAILSGCVAIWYYLKQGQKISQEETCDGNEDK
jgi:hypothetical protein